MSEHIVKPTTYVFILLALLVGTALTVAVAYQDIPHPWDTVVAIAIAVSKMTLVVLFFMHVKYASRMNKLIVVTAGLFLLLLFGITLGDYLSRGWLGIPGR